MTALISAPGERAHDHSREQQHMGIETPTRNQAEPVDQCHGAQSAPTKAASGTAQAPPARVAIAITAPSPAPLERPRRYGSASGFRIMA